MQKKEVEFELYTQDHVEEQIEFMDDVNALLERSQVIMSTRWKKRLIDYLLMPRKCNLKGINYQKFLQP